MLCSIRRWVLGLLVLAMPALALMLGLGACKPRPTLRVLTWADYVDPELLRRFEQRHQCRVLLDVFDSNEAMLARLKAGQRGHDVILPSAYALPALLADDLIEPLDHALLPHLGEVDLSLLPKLPDPPMRHAVPYTLGYAMLAVDAQALPDAQPTWQLMADPRVQGRCTLLDDMRETMGVALKTLGFSLNSRDEAQLAAAGELLLQWRGQIAKFENEAYKAGIDSGEFKLVHGYSGDLWQVAQQNPRLRLILPREGLSMNCDEMVLARGCTQRALAHAFIDFLLEPEVSAQNMQFMGYVCPNKGGLKLVAPAFLKHPALSLEPALRARCEAIEDLGPDLQKYNRVWERVKAGR
jgi:spermidine/putrescine transport system substrate-binding protein